MAIKEELGYRARQLETEIDDRTGLIDFHKWFLFRNVPRGLSWLHTLGFCLLIVFVAQAVTGVILAMSYEPSASRAYESIQEITMSDPFGWLVRGMHKWGASMMIVLLFLHMAASFVMGSYKYPRELTWITGVLIFALMMAMGLTGYLLVWDQRAYWATVVGININGSAPFLGPFIAEFLRGGSEYTGDILPRFYSIHMLQIPGAIAGLIGLHMYLVTRLGVAPAPWAEDDPANDPEAWS
jgi:menaquinol-cytochrome c reductase cytochrome b subunit